MLVPSRIPKSQQKLPQAVMTSVRLAPVRSAVQSCSITISI